MKKSFLKLLCAMLALVTLFASGCAQNPEDEESTTAATTTASSTSEPEPEPEPEPKPEPEPEVPKPLSLVANEYELLPADEFEAISGTWTPSEYVLTASNLSQSNSFAMTDFYVAAGISFSIEMTITIEEGGRGGGIVFGVADKSTPSACWYCINVDEKAGAPVTKFFSQGAVGGSSTTTHANNTLVLADSYKLKVEMDSSGNLVYYINDALITQHAMSNYAGGYIGVYSFKANCKFSNISYKIGDVIMVGSDISIKVGETSYPLSVEGGSPYIDIGETTETAVLHLSLAEGHSVTIDGQKYEGKVEYTLPTAYGETVVTELEISDAQGNVAVCKVSVERSTPAEYLYTERYRPQYHYSPKQWYMNDPNGLVYNATTGEYHLFYQYRPGIVDTADTKDVVWGHAVSKDLMHWTELGIALDMGEDGRRIYSGSAVIDYNNTSGLFNDSVPPASRMVVMYTTYIAKTPEPNNIAYSLDDGYTWIKYEGNPVLTTDDFLSFRDPNLLWIEDDSYANGGIWLCVMGSKTQVRLYTSHNLIDWEFNSNVVNKSGDAVTSECPELYPLALDGDENNIKWVYSGAGTYYIVGDLVKGTDGKYSFVAEQDTISGESVYGNGRHYYATQGFFNTPSGELITLGWVRDNYIVPGKEWNGCQSLPYKMGLVTAADGTMRLTQEPIDDINTLRGDSLLSAENKTLTTASEALTFDSTIFSMDTSFTLAANSALELTLFGDGEGEATYITFTSNSSGKVTVKYSKTLQNPVTKDVSFDLDLSEDNVIDLRLYVDASIVEFFIDDGLYAFCNRVFASRGADTVTMRVTKGEASVSFVNAYAMNSTWTAAK